MTASQWAVTDCGPQPHMGLWGPLHPKRARSARRAHCRHSRQGRKVPCPPCEGTFTRKPTRGWEGHGRSSRRAERPPTVVAGTESDARRGTQVPRSIEGGTHSHAS